MLQTETRSLGSPADDRDNMVNEPGECNQIRRRYGEILRAKEALQEDSSERSSGFTVNSCPDTYG